MQEQQINIITKYLSNEASSEEENFLFDEMKTNKELKAEFDKINKLWQSFNNEQKEFDASRIKKLIDLKISINKKQKQNKIINITLKYAAIFIGIIFLAFLIKTDLQSTKVIVNNTKEVKKITLPDNSIISLNSNAKLEYNNSTLKEFNREVKINGEAFFEISKLKGKKFTVHTPDFNINVLGTKFNVRTYDKDQSVVLTEGKVLLNSFTNKDSEIIMHPGEIVEYSKENSTFILHEINTKIYTSWLNHKLEFDNFSLNELAELVKLRYNKDLIISNKQIAEKRISGSAPSDDINLIIKALETILKTKIEHKENQLLIN